VGTSRCSRSVRRYPLPAPSPLFSLCVCECVCVCVVCESVSERVFLSARVRRGRGGERRCAQPLPVQPRTFWGMGGARARASPRPRWRRRRRRSNERERVSVFSFLFPLFRGGCAKKERERVCAFFFRFDVFHFTRNAALHAPATPPRQSAVADVLEKKEKDGGKQRKNHDNPHPSLTSFPFISQPLHPHLSARPPPPGSPPRTPPPRTPPRPSAQCSKQPGSAPTAPRPQT
jgi:hypothetical protein